MSFIQTIRALQSTFRFFILACLFCLFCVGQTPKASGVGVVVVDGSHFSRDSAGVQRALNTIGPLGFGTVQLTPGVYHFNSTVVVNARAISIDCMGHGTSIIVESQNLDVFQVNNELFSLKDCQFVSLQPRSAGSFLRAHASQGRVSNIVLDGEFYDVFNLEADGSSAFAHSWDIGSVRALDGNSNHSFLRIAATQGTVADTNLHNITLAGTWTDGAIVLDSGTDSFRCNACSIGGNGKMVVARDSLHTIAPRWIRFINSYCESHDNTCMELLATRDFRYQGYVASSRTGVEIGPNARDVGISNTEFVDIQNSAVQIDSGAIGVTLSGNTFENTGLSGSNSIEVGDASDVVISLNVFHSLNPALPSFNLHFKSFVRSPVVFGNVFNGARIAASNALSLGIVTKGGEAQ